MAESLKVETPKVQKGRRFHLLAILATVSLLAQWGTAAGQTPGGPSGTVHEVDDTDFPKVSVILTLAGTGGRSVNGLTPESFTATETGKPARVSRLDSVLDQQVGIDVVLAIDTSGSMFGTPIAQAKQAATVFVQGLQPSDRAAVLRFSSSATVAAGFEPDRAKVVDALGSLQAGGDTALYAALLESIRVAKTGTSPRKAVILLSDGVDFGGPGTREDAIAAAVTSGIPVYAIGLGTGIDRAFLENIARVSGGAFLEAPDSSGIAALYERLAQLLKSQYVLTVDSTAAADVRNRSLRLSIRTSDGVIQLTHDYETRRTLVSPTATVVPSLVVVQEDRSSRDYTVVIWALMAPIVLGGLAYLTMTGRSRLRARRLEGQLNAMISRASAEMQSVGSPAIQVSRDRTTYLRIEGPDAQLRVRVDSEPLTIGSNASNQIRLKGDERLGEAHARIWHADGKLTYHHLDNRHTSKMNGRVVTWVSLKDGDEVELGPYRLYVESE